MSNITYSFVEGWLNLLEKYWIDKKIEKVLELFKQTTFYQETPFSKPYTTIEEIKEEWQHIKNETIKKVEFQIVAIENNIVIVEWYLEQNNEIYDGIYEIKFNEKLECIYFKSWEMSK